MESATLSIFGIDLVQLGSIALTVLGLVLTIVSVKIARATLEANKIAVDLAAEAAGPIDLAPTVVGDYLHITNRSLRIDLRNLWLSITGDKDAPREEFIAGADLVAGRCRILEQGATLRLPLKEKHLASLGQMSCKAVVGAEYSVIEGTTPLHWHAQNVNEAKS